MSKLSSFIRLDREYKSVMIAVDEQLAAARALPIAVNGLSGGAQMSFLTECLRDLSERVKSPVLVLVPTEDETVSVCEKLNRAGIPALRFPKRDLIFHAVTASHDVDRERLSVLSAVSENRAVAVVSTASSALSRMMPPETLATASLSVAVGDTVDPSSLAHRLEDLGFVAVDMVESAGQFARRGGIFDVYTGADAYPIRLEFFGDEIDRMAHFDAETQRVISPCERMELHPAEEVTVSAEMRNELLKTVEKLLSRVEDEASKEVLSREKTALRDGLSLPFRDKYISKIYPGASCLLSYLNVYRRTPIFFYGTAGIYEDIAKQTDAYHGEQETLVSLGRLPSGLPPFALGKGEFDAFAASNLPIHINPFSGGVDGKLGGLFGFRCRRTVSYGDNPAMLFEDLAGLRKGLYRTVIVCENKQGAQSLLESLTSSEIPAVPLWDYDIIDYNSLQNGIVYVTVDDLTEGFDLLMAKVAVLTMQKDGGRSVMAHRKSSRILKRAGGAGEKLFSYADLSPGDYAVHERFGIGRFEGIQTVTMGGITKDYITLKYAEGGELLVPCDRLESIGKYIGPKNSDGEVKLSHMGGKDWEKTKAKTKSAVRDIAKDLIRIYAQRQRLPGFAFAKDSEMEEEFDNAFEFEPTDSQLRAIEEIKSDMCKSVPMNRLLCGDVGFGKTEVALRAAFKAIANGKQVAILVPTTILALQHYQTALSRMRGYAVNVEMLSRFRSPKQQAEIFRKVARGEVDLLVGTHRILSKNLQFRDLGLLIIDEEQRFGVSQKEKLRDLGQNVDTLTLTATPIPRTLNMAMNGIADMSLLEEAPIDRRPVQTYVLEHDDLLLVDAMKRELNRGGQVLYLYNRVESIAFVADKIAKALPEARVTYAHGQMDREELEDIWQMLVRGELDVLVCTTIIETGVDLPNANTLIIEDADRMGLAQLHQLRGRVGRSSRQAYAYFTFRPGKSLSEVATKRLETIREFAEFGAGFQIALRDLEIRGAGNLLGAEQHGYMEGVGYELYVRLLNEAVLEEKGVVQAKPFESKISLPVSAHIPPTYIAASAGRMEMYKKISLIRIPEDMDDVLDELIDRYGEPPIETQKLLQISLLRALAEEAHVRLVELRGQMLTFTMEKPNLADWSEVFASVSGLSFRGNCVLAMLRHGEDETEKALSVLKAYHKATQSDKTENGNKEATP